MAAVSGALIFIGYQLVAYGWSQVKGSNAGFFDILWPGRFKGAMPDTPAAPSPPPAPNSGGVAGAVTRAGDTVSGQSTGGQTVTAKGGQRWTVPPIP